MSKYGKVSFKGKIVSTFEKEKRARSSFSYVNIPKGIKMFSLPDGVSSFRLDFLPYLVTDPKHPDHIVNPEAAQLDNIWWRRPFKIHRNVGANNETIVCPTSFGKKCPICEYQTKRFKEGADKKELSDLRAKSRSLYIVIPIGADKYDEVPFIWDMSNENFAVTLKEELDSNPNNEDFFMFETGKTLNMRIKWETLSTNTYPVVRRIDFEDRDPYKESILEDIPSLDGILKELSYEEVRDKFFDMGEDADTDKVHKHTEEEEETPKTFRRDRSVKEDVKKEEEEVSTRKRSSRVVEEEDEPKEEKETPPARRVRPEPAKAVKKDRCPYGHKFGEDTDKFGDCDSCEIWDDCMDEKEKK